MMKLINIDKSRTQLKDKPIHLYVPFKLKASKLNFFCADAEIVSSANTSSNNATHQKILIISKKFFLSLRVSVCLRVINIKR